MGSETVKSGWLSKMFGRESGSEGAIDVDEDKVLESIRQSELFSDLSPQHLNDMLARMESCSYKEGDYVIREGEEGDYYYALVKGHAVVTKGAGESETELARLEVLTCFGEEALISNAKRNASIRMLCDGLVIRLSKADFNEHVKEPLLEWVNPLEAMEAIRKGRRWLDVRSDDQYQRGHMQHALSLPLESLRAMAETVDKSTGYVCYCQNGRQSSTAAFLLTQFGFDVTVLRGGLDRL